KIAVPVGSFKPYLIVGAGGSLNYEKIRGTPEPGLVWLATGTNDTRNLTASCAQAFTAELRVGCDLQINESVTSGVDIGYLRSGPLVYPLTPEGNQVSPGSPSFTSRLESVTVAFHADARF